VRRAVYPARPVSIALEARRDSGGGETERGETAHAARWIAARQGADRHACGEKASRRLLICGVRERVTFDAGPERSKLNASRDGHITGMEMTQRERSTAAVADTNEAEQTGVRVTSRKSAPHAGIELLSSRARVVIAHMAPDDPRARLLQVAILRRDEILLEALLHRLGSMP